MPAGPHNLPEHDDLLAELYESSRAIGLRDCIDDLLDEVLDQAQRLIGAEHAALMLYDEDTDRLVTACLRGYGTRAGDLRHRTLALGEGLSGWAAWERQAVRVGDVRTDSRYLEGLAKARSNLAVPLVAGNQLAGVLNVESERTDAFSAEHERLLTVLGAQAALAIVACWVQRDLRTRINQMEAVNRISRLAGEGGAIGATLNSMLEIAQEIVPRAQCAILLLDPDKQVLRVAAGQGYQAVARYLEIPVGRGVTGRCVEAGETQVVMDLASEADELDYIQGIPGAISEVAVPLLADGRIIGVFNAESVQRAAFGEHEVQTLELVARQVASVVRSAQLLEETRRLAVTDPLTGLHNRRHFTRQLDENVRRSARYGERLALVLLDVDFFKTVNDRFGHHVGDRALQLLAGTLAEAVRETDQTARIGGEEFALLLLRCDRDLALSISERVRSQIRELVIDELPDVDMDLSASVGVAFFPDDGADPKTLMRVADDALYRAKRRGRDQVVLASELGGIG
ncbi:MAG: sensor domain-containing diguanylate cyclase [marine benthic group bacterium]|nr:sensor domain-containing diguanylate cyclase [Gemmatimonadota bacterium]